MQRRAVPQRLIADPLLRQTQKVASLGIAGPYLCCRGCLSILRLFLVRSKPTSVLSWYRSDTATAFPELLTGPFLRPNAFLMAALYPTITQCASVTAALKVLLFPA